MQSVWQLNNSKKLLLFFSGWGMDERPTAHLTAGDYDVCTCFNYLSLESADREKWTAYDKITVVAWSMGVWAAERVLANAGLYIHRAVAVNGTPKPVDDMQGIPVATAQGTLDGLTPESLKRFYRRMLGSGSLLKRMKEARQLPVIDFIERKEELRRIIGQKPYTETGFAWDKAIIGTEDMIFPPANLRAYWKGKAEITEIDAPHDPFHLFNSWKEVVDAQ